MAKSHATEQQPAHTDGPAYLLLYVVVTAGVAAVITLLSPVWLVVFAVGGIGLSTLVGIMYAFAAGERRVMRDG